jgi:uncharacterized protein YndB with AHSA1/START domain
MKLQVSLPSDREILITRSFNAPRRLVFDAHTKPELLRRWLSGPDGWAWVVCEVDLREGGAYRWVWRGPDGVEMGIHGVHREIVVPERLTCTQIFEMGRPGDEAIGTLVLTEKDGQTTLRNTTLYPSKEARDGALQSGMADGMEAGFARLDQLITSL